MKLKTILGLSVIVLSNLALTQASKADTQPSCAAPNPDASMLFSLVSDPSTSVATVKNFLQSHSVGWDALNEKCETVFDVSVDLNRQDLFTALFNQYKPDLSDDQSGEDSIYTYVLAHSTPEFLIFLQKVASTHQQILSPPEDLTALMVAAGYNPSARMIQYLVAHGNSVNAKNSEGYTALMVAIYNSNPDVVRALIQAGAEINAADNDGHTAVLFASKHANIAVLQSLIQAGADVNIAAQNGLTPLMNALFAPKESRLDAVEALIQAGANVNAVYSDGQTVLISAVIDKSDVAVVRALIQAGADVNAVNSKGFTALILAGAKNSDIAVVRALIQAGADVNAASSDGYKVLMFATVYNSDVAVVRALIQAGADVNAASSDGNTALMLAACPFKFSSGGKTYQEPLQDQIIEALLAAGANQQAQALSIAQSFGAPQSMLTLLGAQPSNQ